ncbi:MAG: DNA recombination protein RmuC [Dehalococcoidia bacterium]|nr:DNA recombination protein RmuC [Dehalococcoidia bacterium]
MELLLASVAIAVLAVVVVFVARRPAAPPPGGLAVPELVQVADAVRALQTQTAVLVEKVGGIGERVGAVEQQQGTVREGINRLGVGLERTSTLAGGLRDTTESIRAELQKASDGLAAIQAGATARRTLEDETARSIRRLEQVIAGSAARGAAGENMVDLVFSRLPAEWQARDFRIGARVVEFALRLPNGLVLPIDSKWPATNLLDQLAAAEDPAERARLKSAIEQEARAKAREVAKYLNPELTLSFGVAVVPDAVYDVCGAVQAECVRDNVVLVSHSMFVPYLLLVFQTVLRNSRDVDLEKLAAHLQVADQALRALGDEVEGRLSRAITMLGNSRDDLRAQVSRATTGLAAIHAHAEVDLADLQLPAEQAELLPAWAARE